MTARNICIAAAAAVLALAGAFYVGRATKPAEVQYKTEWLMHSETKSTEQSQSKQAQKVVYRNQKTSAVDQDTKCSEDFDRQTGKLIHRTCEKTSHSVAQVNQQGRATSTTDTTTSKTTETKQDQQSSTTSVTKYDVSNWNLSLGAYLDLSDIVHGQLSKPTLHLELDRKLIGPLWAGVWAESNTSFNEKKFGVDLQLSLSR
jgi:hypothetical protein